LGITKALEYKVKSVPRLGCMEFTNIMEVFNGQEVVSKHVVLPLMQLVLRQWPTQLGRR
jgi:hypothetical protein